MAYYENLFNTSGKIPTTAPFWQMAVDRFASSDGITPKFSRVIAEQMFAPLNSPKTPFYNRFAGRPINAGVGWTERVVEQKAVEHFNPKATAEDALKFYDNTGIEKNFTIDYEMVRSDSLPSELASIEEFLERNSVGTLNDILVSNQIDAYQMAVDSAIALKAISNTPSEVACDVTDMTALYETIRDTATDMMMREEHFNNLTTEENANIDTSANEVLAFMSVKTWNQLRSSRASLPSPGELVDNVTVIPVYGLLPTPLTSAQYAEQPSTGITWDVQPTAIDKVMPTVWLCDPRAVEYRPLIGSYRVNINRNGRGDFSNQHLIARGAIGVRPWYNMVRIIAE